ncbi:MAG: hypothetical protein R3A11_06780 [Bdellovibrionota bacterium]
MIPEPYKLSAFHVADKFSLKEVRKHVLPHPRVLDSTHIGSDFGDGFVFVYSFGAVCFFNVAKSYQHDFWIDSRTHFRR